VHPLFETSVFDALERPNSAIPFDVTRALARLRPDKCVVATDVYLFDLDDFAEAGRCTVVPMPGVPLHTRMYLDEAQTRLLPQTMNAWRRVSWEGLTLEVVTLSLADNNNCFDSRHWIIGATPEEVHRFVLAVCNYDALANDRVVVFESGRFKKSTLFADAVSATRADDLVLGNNLKAELFADAARFFERRDFYERHRLPWKRGLLLVGPPGNGKTQSIKALLQQLGQPVVFVKSFSSREERADEGIRKVFQRARRLAPAVLVLEDLDCLVPEEHRSALLNELDGFALNTGLLTIATTNHPEKLDRSILDRPSRFDRKFHFPLPGEAERAEYIARWVAAQVPAMQLSAEGQRRVAERSRGFTFAYLKELLLSSSLRWANDAAPGAMDQVAIATMNELREQMESSALVLGPLASRKAIGFAEEASGHSRR
jgi:AAA+ superfamily predicted ATPase